MASSIAQAHQLDETLVGSLILLSPTRISVQVDITPGALLAREVHELIDLDRDGTISQAEEMALGQQWAKQARVEVDGAAGSVRAVACEVPELETLLSGTASSGSWASSMWRRARGAMPSPSRTATVCPTAFSR
jgi:hypothetical protein